MAIEALSLSVVGAAYPNADGSSRKFEVMLCERGELVTLVPEPKNKYDEHAIAVLSARRVQIGYITSERAVFVAQLLRAGHTLHAIFQGATDWGAVIRVGIDAPPELPPLPTPSPSAEFDQDDSGFWSDYIPPDD